MRCTKCGFTSFDYLDRCKNCGEDLVPTKIKLNIYTKSPEIEVGEDGFVLTKVTSEKKDKLSANEPKKRREVSMEDVFREDGGKIESFDFGEDKDR